MVNRNMDNLSEKERIILSFIGEGKDNGTSLHDLAYYSGMESREMRLIIEEMRRKGIIILSGVHGYYYPSNTEEIEEYVKREDKRARSIMFTIKAARKLLRERESSSNGKN